MVQTEEELIGIFKEFFTVVEGILYWKKGVNKGKIAGSKYKHYWVTSITIKKVSIRFYNHRIIYAIYYNKLPLLIDHIDRNTFNNNISNLREATKQLNSINRNPPKNNKTGFKGVSYRPKLKVYHAQIKVNQVKKHLGTFKNIEDAIRARKSAEKLYWSDI